MLFHKNTIAVGGEATSICIMGVSATVEMMSNFLYDSLVNSFIDTHCVLALTICIPRGSFPENFGSIDTAVRRS